MTPIEEFLTILRVTVYRCFADMGVGGPDLSNLRLSDVVVDHFLKGAQFTDGIGVEYRVTDDEGAVRVTVAMGGGETFRSEVVAFGTFREKGMTPDTVRRHAEAFAANLRDDYIDGDD